MGLVCRFLQFPEAVAQSPGSGGSAEVSSHSQRRARVLEDWLTTPLPMWSPGSGGVADDSSLSQCRARVLVTRGSNERSLFENTKETDVCGGGRGGHSCSITNNPIKVIQDRV